MAFLYYISGLRTKPTESILNMVGISHACGSVTPTDVGPDMLGGMCFTLKGKDKNIKKLGYYHADQEWTQIPDTKLWIGFEINNKPKPEDFIKGSGNFISGYEIKLADDNNWIIPLARSFEEGCVLPKAISMLNGDTVEMVTITKYLKLQSIAKTLSCLLPWEDQEASEIAFDKISLWSEQFKLCVEVLQTNYDLDYREISILRILATSNTVELLKLVVDFPAIIKHFDNEKKKLSHDTNSGQAV